MVAGDAFPACGKGVVEPKELEAFDIGLIPQ
jgi:hypothetical protein